MVEIGVNVNAIKLEMEKNNVKQAIIDQFMIEHDIKNGTNIAAKPQNSETQQSATAPRLPNSLMAAINANNIAPTTTSATAAPLPMNHGPPPAPIPANVPTPNVYAHGITNGMVSSSIIPKQHRNPG